MTAATPPLSTPGSALALATIDTFRNRVTCVDAETLCRSLPANSVNAVITDPPYGLFGGAFVKRPDTGCMYHRVNETWDTEAPTAWMAACRRVLKPGGSVICFGGRDSIYALAAEGLRLGWRIVNDITWHKPDATPNFTGRMMTESTERILWFCPDGTGWTYNRFIAKSMNHGNNLRDVWTFGQTRDNRVHPTQKPLELMERLVALLTNPDDVILDPFCGSGTTLDAAQKLGRRYIGGDISAEYVALAQKRLALPYDVPLFADPAA